MMKKVLSAILALTLVFSLAALFTGCGSKSQPTTTAVQTTAEATTAEETTTEKNLPKAGETLTFGSAKVTIPEGWVVDAYEEGKKVDLNPENDSFPTVTIELHKVYDNNHAKEWADNINGNYGGKCEIDQVEIGGKSFYRVKADAEQNVCFTDLDDSNYLEVAVMFMPWEDGAAVLNNIALG